MDPKSLINVLVASVLFAFSLVSTYYANYFATIRASNPVSDLILDNLPVMDVGSIYGWGMLIAPIFLVLVLLYEPKRIPFVLKGVAVFYLVRSFFIILTHLALPADVPPGSLSAVSNIFSSGGDLFFSGHAGLPFLMALVFWNQKYLRWIFIILSVLGSGMVLIGHMHYSIDVFSAYFIAYGIYKFCQYIFEKDYRAAELDRLI
ncbi:MAG: phosphatase PAP2-related protein [bacterium]